MTNKLFRKRDSDLDNTFPSSGTKQRFLHFNASFMPRKSKITSLEPPVKPMKPLGNLEKGNFEKSVL